MSAAFSIAPFQHNIYDGTYIRHTLWYRAIKPLKQYQCFIHDDGSDIEVINCEPDLF